MKRIKKNDNPSPKPQKTIIDFFRRQSTEPTTPVLKITCPACFLEVSESKINWHLDQDCKSREMPKKKKDGNLAKRKKILKSVKNEIANKKKQKVMLSDDEEDELNMSDDSDVRIIENENSADDEPYITSSMVETHIFEIEGEHCTTPAMCQSSSSLNADQNALSPHFSQKEKNTKIKMENEIIGSPELRLASLQADWESPCLTPPSTSSSPGKENTPSNGSNPAVEGMLKKDSNKSLLTPSKLSLNKQQTELVVDTGLDGMEDDTYQATPLKHSKESSKSHSKLFKASMEGKEKCKILSGKSSDSFITGDDRLDGDSDDDFETPIHFRTPDKLPKKRLKSIFGSENKNKTSGVVCSVLSDVSLPPVSGPADDMNRGPADDMNRGPADDMNRVDSTSVSSEKKVEHIRRLFPTSSTESSQGSICESEASSCKVVLSQDINSSTNRFPKIDKEKVFDALLNTASQSQNSEISQSQGSSIISSQSQGQTNQDEEKKRLWVRTPRKINQSIKSTGILQSSPQNVSKNFIARRMSFSLSPQKQSQSPNKQIGNSQSSPSVSEVIAENKYDKSIFRRHKGYYLENFILIMTTVFSEPGDLQLFNEEDQSIVKSFHKLSLQAQKLYVRLFQRKLKWNRVSKLDYRDICDQEDMELYVKELSYANFLRLESELCDPNEVLQLLTADEVKNLCKKIKISSSGKKEDLIKSLLNFNKSQPSLLSTFSKNSSGNSVILKQAKELLGQSCLVNKDVHRVFMRIIMLYGLPRYDDEDDKVNHTQLTTLLMVNLGKMIFPKYDVVRQHAIFQSRDELIRFEGCSQILSDLHDCLERQQWEESLQYCELAKVTHQELINNKQLMTHDLSLPTFLRCYTSMSVLVYIMSCSVECYQRLKNYRKAVEQLRFLLNQTSYLQDYRGRWYDRLALNLEVYLKSPSETLEVIKEALNDPEVREGHRLSLSIRAERMAASSRSKSLAPQILELPLMKPREAPKVIIEGRSLPGDAGYKKVFIRQDSDRHAGEGEVTVCSVEELVINHYKNLGYSEGLHREGSTVRSLFGLFFWDIIYSSVPDVFRSPHQAAPIDLNDPHFYVARKNLIDEKLSQLEGYTEQQAGAELERIWNEHTGKIAMVDWNLFRSLDYVKGLVSSLKLPVVASICRRLAIDHRFTRSGFPDLIVWNPDNKKSCVVEVKGPNDRLSTKQILWLDYLLEHGAVAEVCHVEAIGAKKMKLASPRRISPKKQSPVKVSSAEGKTKSKSGMRKTSKTENKQRQNSKSVKSSGISNDQEEADFQFTGKKQKKIQRKKVQVGSKSPKESSGQESMSISKKKLTKDVKKEKVSKVKKAADVLEEKEMLKSSKHLNNASRENEDSNTEDGISIKQQKQIKIIKDIQNISQKSKKRKKDADIEEDECSKPPEKQSRYITEEQVEMKGQKKQATKTGQKKQATKSCQEKNEDLKPTKKSKISQENEEEGEAVIVTRNGKNKARKSETEIERIDGNLRRSSRRQ